MSPDHLYKEGLAELEDIEIPSNIIVIFTILLVIFYGTHNNVHFYLFEFITSIFYQIYQLGSDLHDMLFHWYLVFQYNCQKTQRIPSPDSAKSRHRHNQQGTSPETKAPKLETVFTSRPQIYFQFCSIIEHFSTSETFTPDIGHILPQVSKSHICVNIIPISEPPQLQKYTQLEELIKSEVCYRNFINQDLSFLHPSTVFSNKDLGNKAASEPMNE